MNPYQRGQEWMDLRWGTQMPVAVMVGSQIAQYRARGSFSGIVVDPTRLAAEEPDPENLSIHLQSLAVVTITELLGELSGTASNVGQLTAITAQTIQAFKSMLEAKFTAMGLQLKDASIDAIESL